MAKRSSGFCGVVPGLRLLIVMSGLLVLTACGGNNGSLDGGVGAGSGSGPGSGGSNDVQTTDMQVTGSLGRIRNALALALSRGGQEIEGASAELDDNGTATLSVPADLDEPVVIEIRGDDDAEYFDEALQAFRPFAADRRIRAVVPMPQANVGVTALTELAATMLDANPDATADDINMANEMVRTLFAPNILDITTPPAVIDENSDSDSLVANDAGRYAAVLGALAELGAASENPALAVLEQFSADVADGVLDGLVDDMAVSNPIVDVAANDFPNRFRAALDSALAKFGSDELMASEFDEVVNALTENLGNIGGGTGGGSICGPFGDPSPATIPADFSAAPFDLTFEQTNMDAPIMDGDQRTFTFSSAGVISIDGVEIASDPVLCGGNQFEALWRDDANGLIYALSALTQQFNEVNVFAANDDRTFFGQYKLPGPVGPPQGLLDLAGDFMATIVESCSRQSSCPSSGVPGDVLMVSLGANGSAEANGVVFDVQNADLQIIDATSGSIEPRYELIVPGTEDGSSSTLKIYVEEGAAVAFSLVATRSCGNGCSSSSDVYAENRPLPMDLTTFFTDSVNGSPVTLTIVTDDTTYNSGMNSALRTPFGGSSLCQELELSSAVDVASIPNTDIVPAFSYALDGAGGNNYFRRSSRFRSDATSNDRTLSFQGAQLVWRGDGAVDLVEGFQDNTDLFVNTPRDRATSSQTEIDTACADFRTITGSATFVVGGNFTLELVDSLTDTVLAQQILLGGVGETVPFEFIQPIDTQFELRKGFSSPTTLVCQFTNGTGTLGPMGIDNVSASCDNVP